MIKKNTLILIFEILQRSTVYWSNFSTVHILVISKARRCLKTKVFFLPESVYVSVPKERSHPHSIPAGTRQNCPNGDFLETQ